MSQAIAHPEPLPKFVELCLPKFEAGEKLVIDKDQQQSTFKPSGENIPFHPSMLHAHRLQQLGAKVEVVGTKPYRMPVRPPDPDEKADQEPEPREPEWMTVKEIQEEYGVSNSYPHAMWKKKRIQRKKYENGHIYLVTGEARKQLIKVGKREYNRTGAEKKNGTLERSETPEEAEPVQEWLTCQEICDRYGVRDSYPSYLHTNMGVDRRKRGNVYEYGLTSSAKEWLEKRPSKKKWSAKDVKVEPAPEPELVPDSASEASQQDVDVVVDDASGDGGPVATGRLPALPKLQRSEGSEGSEVPARPQRTIRQIALALRAQQQRPKWTPLAQLTGAIENVNTVNIEFEGRIDQVIDACDRTIEAARLAKVTRRRARLMKWINQRIWK